MILADYSKEVTMSLRKTLTISFLMGLLTLPVYALSLNEAMSALGTAKSNGLVGEQADGYLGVVKDEQNASEIAKLINNARKQEYQRIAKQSNAPLVDVEKMAGTKAQEKTTTGQFIQVNGQWKKK